MNEVKAIRIRLGLSQQDLGDGIGCTQTNIGHYERGQQLPPQMAQKLIEFAAQRGLQISFDHIYGVKPLPELAQPTTSTKEVGND